MERLSNTYDPAAAAGFLQGFFEINALALVKSRPVVAALDAYLVAIDKERFPHRPSKDCRSGVREEVVASYRATSGGPFAHVSTTLGQGWALGAENRSRS